LFVIHSVNPEIIYQTTKLYVDQVGEIRKNAKIDRSDVVIGVQTLSPPLV